MKVLSALAVVMSALLLQGCIAAAVVGTAAVGTKAATDPRTVGTRAKQIAMGVEGTAEVFNEIRQGQPIGLGTASSDTWITTKVRSQLLGTDQVKSSNVKVTTENGEVFLLGLVTEREGKAAADIASRVSGVKHVTTAFTYIK